MHIVFRPQHRLRERLRPHKSGAPCGAVPENPPISNAATEHGKHQLHSHSLLGKWRGSGQLTLVRRGLWPSPSKIRPAGQTLKENPREETSYRRCARRCLSQPRLGRRFPQQLFGPLVRCRAAVIEVPMTNLFPLPYWAPALKRVPTALQALDQAFTCGDHVTENALSRDCPGNCPELCSLCRSPLRTRRGR